MENSPFKKQFGLSLYDDSLLITTPSNNSEAYDSELNLQVGKEIKIGWHDWLETEEDALNYHECCGILILFGITPPSFEELYKLLV